MAIITRIDGRVGTTRVGAAALVLLVAACADRPGVAPGLDKRLVAELGPRPVELVGQMRDGALKSRLQNCVGGPFYRSRLSIGHRGAPRQYPEHTRESYLAAARMGAGMVECDVTFTRDRQLVCRHSQCDLHRTTNILETGLAGLCQQAFRPADAHSGRPASARCCTSDISLEDFLSLRGRPDTVDRNASTIAGYLRIDAVDADSYQVVEGTLMSHRDSIELFRRLGVAMIPELKAAAVPMPYQGVYTQADYARQMIDEYRRAGVAPESVFPQSFNLDDLRTWNDYAPRYGRQGVYLDGRYAQADFDPSEPLSWEPTMAALREQGIRLIAPPLWVLLREENDAMVASAYAREARLAGLELITWTLETRGQLGDPGNPAFAFYYRSVAPLVESDGDVFVVLDALVRQAGVVGVFSNWPATVTYYANCEGP